MTKSKTLSKAIRNCGLELEKPHMDQLDRYCVALWEENQQLNLTRHVDYDTFVSRDLVDSMQLSKLIRPGESLLDIGTGGGVPGVVLAIIRPDLTVQVCDSVRKKAAAVQRIADRIGVDCEVHPVRAEELLEDIRVDLCVARAVGPLWKICYWLRDSWVAAGRLLAIKGPKWKLEYQETVERGSLRKLNFKLASSYPMHGTESESVVLKLWAKGTAES